MKPISPEWTPTDRLRVIAALLPQIQDDIYAGNYSVPGRPNITSLQHIIAEPASVLEAMKDVLIPVVQEYEAKL